jgi:hypothetical protein
LTHESTNVGPDERRSAHPGYRSAQAADRQANARFSQPAPNYLPLIVTNS